MACTGPPWLQTILACMQNVHRLPAGLMRSARSGIMQVLGLAEELRHAKMNVCSMLEGLLGMQGLLTSLLVSYPVL